MLNKIKRKDSYRKASIAAGILFLTGTFAGILSIAPAIDSTDYLVRAYEDINQVKIAAMFQFIMAVSYIGFAMLLFPALRLHDKYLSIGFVGFRLMAGVFNLLGVVIIFLLVTLSKEYIDAGTPVSSYFETLGTLLREGRDIVNHIVMILIHSIGGLILYYLLYRTKIVPRWLSLWGIIGTVVTIFATMLVTFDVIGIITPIYIILSLPMALLEIVLAIWLIIRGFSNSISENTIEKK